MLTHLYKRWCKTGSEYCAQLLDNWISCGKLSSPSPSLFKLGDITALKIASKKTDSISWHHWPIIALLIAFWRANKGNPLMRSIIDLIPCIIRCYARRRQVPDKKNKKLLVSLTEMSCFNPRDSKPNDSDDDDDTPLSVSAVRDTVSSASSSSSSSSSGSYVQFSVKTIREKMHIFDFNTNTQFKVIKAHIWLVEYDIKPTDTMETIDKKVCFGNVLSISILSVV